MEEKIKERKKILDILFNIYLKKHPLEKESVEQLKIYSYKKIEKCPNLKDDIYCSSCKIHCYDKKK